MEFEGLCVLAPLLSPFCRRSALSAVLFTGPPTSRAQLAVPQPPFLSPRGEVLPSMGLMSLRGPLSCGWWSVCALGSSMGGPPLTLCLDQKIPKKGVVCIEGTKAFPHTHTINMLLWVYSLTLHRESNHLWLQESLDVGPEKPWARLWIRVMQCGKFSIVAPSYETSWLSAVDASGDPHLC